MGLTVGMVGVGTFAQSFIPLFKAHPAIDRVILCDVNADKLVENAAKHDIAETVSSLDDLCARGDVDAAAIITQNWMHAPQATQALRAGMNVYSAVPTGISVEEITELFLAVEETGLTYMLGETSYYYPAVIYCRKRFQDGDFGRAVFGEADYYHHFDHGLYDVMKWRGGDRWREFAGGPPMHYPTHSTSQIISVTGAHMTHVSCQGFVDDHEDGLFRADVNMWGNTFSNESALFSMSDGSSCRINEFRRIGHPGAVRMCLFGTEGSFEDSKAGSVWMTSDGAQTESLDEILECTSQPVNRENTEKSGMDLITSEDGTHLHTATVHDVDRLPTEFIGLPNGHSGSHQFLVDDFLTAITNGTTPPNNIWDAARYAIPGVIAHESAVAGGELMEIPDLGDGPSS